MFAALGRRYGSAIISVNLPGAGHAVVISDPVLAKVTNPFYRGFDLDYTDVDRAKVFLNELAEYEKSGNMPRLIVMRMGNDHTSGTAAGKIAPLSAAADNDYAVGLIVDRIAHSVDASNARVRKFHPHHGTNPRIAADPPDGCRGTARGGRFRYHKVEVDI